MKIYNAVSLCLHLDERGHLPDIRMGICGHVQPSPRAGGSDSVNTSKKLFHHGRGFGGGARKIVPAPWTSVIRYSNECEDTTRMARSQVTSSQQEHPQSPCLRVYSPGLRGRGSGVRLCPPVRQILIIRGRSEGRRLCGIMYLLAPAVSISRGQEDRREKEGGDQIGRSQDNESTLRLQNEESQGCVFSSFRGGREAGDGPTFCV